MAWYRCGGIPSDLLDEIMVSKASGVVAEFDTDMPNTNVYSAITNIDITQKGEGVPTPSNVRGFVGFTEMNVTQSTKNLFNGVSLILEGFIALQNSRLRSSATARTIVVRCKPNTTYTISKTVGARFFVAYSERYPEFEVTNLCKNIINDNTASSITITTGANALYLLAYVYSETYDSGTAEDMIASVQIEEGETATTKETVTNYAYTLGQTVYCGKLDVLTGLFTVTHILFDLANYVGNIASVASGAKKYFSFTDLVLEPKLEGEIKCDKYEQVLINNSTENVGVDIGKQYKSIFFRPQNPSSYTSSTIMSYITDTLGSLVVCYELDIPTTIQLTGHQLQALSNNKIYTDNGNSTVQFLETLGHRLS